MGKVKIVIADTNEEYLIPLEIKLIHELGNQMDLDIISEKEYYGEYFSTGRSLDIAIVGQELFSKEILKHNIKKIFVLAEEKEEITEERNVFWLDRFTSVKEIYDKVAYESLGNLEEKRSRAKETQLIVVYSPSGGTGKTTLSLGLAAILADSYHKTLYLDAERVQTFQFRMSNKETLASSIGSEIEKNKTNLFAGLRQYLRKENFDYLPAFCTAMESLDIKYEFFAEYIESVKESHEYEYIVVDTDKTLDEGKLVLLEKADKVLLVQRPYMTDKFDMEFFQNNMNLSDQEKFLFICNQCDNLYSADYIANLKYPVNGTMELRNPNALITLEAIKRIEGINKIAYIL